MNNKSGPLRVIHAVSSIAVSMGGPSWVVKSLCENLSGLGHRIIVCAQDDERVAGESIHIDETLADVKRVHRPAFLADILESWNFKHVLRNFEADLIHSHGLWLGVNKACSAIARKRNTGHLITVHGMLEPWGLSNHKWRKRLAGLWFQDRALRDAVCLHATTLQEFNSLRRYGLRNPVAILPVGIDPRDFACSGDRTQIDGLWPGIQGKRIILFLSRIHPKKGLLTLVEAWGRLRQMHRDWHVVIAGPDENGHLAEVQTAIEKAGVLAQTTLIGSVYGELKKRLYAACDLFVLPTFSENFGIVVAEALCSGKPVITTKGTPWQELQTRKCGWWVDIGVEPLVTALKQAMDLSDEERVQMGLRGRQLVEQQYSWPRIAAQMVDVYKWALGQSARPECVRLD